MQGNSTQYPRCAIVRPAFLCGMWPLAKMVSANNVPIGLARYLRSDMCGFVPQPGSAKSRYSVDADSM